MDETQGNSPVENLSRTINAFGGGMPKKRRNDLYFGNPPKDAYMGMNKGRTLETIHDLTISEDTKARLYGIGQRKVEDVGDVVDSRLGTDSKSGLISELADNTAMTRGEATQLVENWMAKNGLVEKDDATLGKIIVPRDRR